jgi:hypothetical protein
MVSLGRKLRHENKKGANSTRPTGRPGKSLSSKRAEPRPSVGVQLGYELMTFEKLAGFPVSP